MNITIYNNINSENLEKLDIIKFDAIKSYLKIDDDSDNDLINEICDAAIEYAEQFLNIKINPVKFTLTYSKVFQENIILPHAKILSLESVFIDSYGEYKLLDQKYYKLIGRTVSFKFPVYSDHLEISYTTGFKSAKDIPNMIKQGILAHIKGIYYHEQNHLDKVHNYYTPFIEYRL